MPDRFFAVKDWHDRQDYDHRDRKSPAPWLKLPTGFFDDPAIDKLPDSQKLLLIGVWIMAAKCRNRVPFDARYIKKRIGSRTTPDLELFADLGLIVELDRKVSAPAGEKSALEERRGEKRREETDSPAAPAAETPDLVLEPISTARPWSEEAADDYREAYGADAEPPGMFFGQLKPRVRKLSWERVRPVLRYYLGQTDPEYLNVAKFLSTFPAWEARMNGGGSRASPKQSVGEQAMRAAAVFLGKGAKG